MTKEQPNEARAIHIDKDAFAKYATSRRLLAEAKTENDRDLEELLRKVPKGKRSETKDHINAIVDMLGPAILNVLDGDGKKAKKKLVRRTTPKKKASTKRAKKASALPKKQRRQSQKLAPTTAPENPCTKKEGCIRGLGHKGRCYRKGITVAVKEDKKVAPPPKPHPVKKPRPKAAHLEEAADTRGWLPCPDPAKCFHPDGKGHAGDHQPNWVEPKEKCFIRSCGREKGHKDNHYPKNLILAR